MELDGLNLCFLGFFGYLNFLLFRLIFIFWGFRTMNRLWKYTRRRLRAVKVLEVDKSLDLIFEKSMSEFRAKGGLRGLTRSSFRPSLFELRALDKITRQRMTHTPLQYLNKIWTYGPISLHVRRPVFIPRPESSQIVDICNEKLDKMEKSKNRKFRFLEVGTGSGAISCLLLHKTDRLEGSGCEILPSAYYLTKKNLTRVLGESWPLYYSIHLKSFEDYLEKYRKGLETGKIPKSKNFSNIDRTRFYRLQPSLHQAGGLSSTRKAAQMAREPPGFRQRRKWPIPHKTNFGAWSRHHGQRVWLCGPGARPLANRAPRNLSDTQKWSRSLVQFG